MNGRKVVASSRSLNVNLYAHKPYVTKLSPLFYIEEVAVAMEQTSLLVSGPQKAHRLNILPLRAVGEFCARYTYINKFLKAAALGQPTARAPYFYMILIVLLLFEPH